MSKKYLVILFLAGFLAAGNAFSQGKETTAKFQDAQHPAFTADYGFPSDVVSEAIEQRLKKDGLSVRSRRGVISSEGVHYTVLTPDVIDLYFQVEGRGRKDADGSRVYLFVSKGKDNFVGGNSDPELAEHAIQYLNDLQHDISLYALQLQVQQQQKSVDGKAKDYKKLLKAARKLESKRYSLQSDLSGETDTRKQQKLRKKISKLDKDIRDKQQDIRGNQRELQSRKDQLSLLQERLKSEQEKQ